MNRYSKAAKDISGIKVGCLTVIEPIGKIDRQLLWKCKCDCGNYTNVRGSSLRSGRTRSCGCLSRKVASENLKRTNRKINRYEFHDGFAIIYDGNGNEIIVDCDKVEYLVGICSWNVGKDGYAHGNVNGKTVKMHRILTSAESGSVVDHINHNRSDNRMDNLRICSQSENMKNTKWNSRNTSGAKGVSFHKARRKYQVNIRVNNHLIHIGYFEDLQSAIEARKTAESKYFGEFAYKEE